MSLFYILQYRQSYFICIKLSFAFTRSMLDLLFTGAKYGHFLIQWQFGALKALAENKRRITRGARMTVHKCCKCSEQSLLMVRQDFPLVSSTMATKQPNCHQERNHIPHHYPLLLQAQSKLGMKVKSLIVMPSQICAAAAKQLEPRHCRNI